MTLAIRRFSETKLISYKINFQSDETIFFNNIISVIKRKISTLESPRAPSLTQSLMNIPRPSITSLPPMVSHAALAFANKNHGAGSRRSSLGPKKNSRRESRSNIRKLANRNSQNEEYESLG